MKIVDLIGADFDKSGSEIALLPVGSVERHGDHLPLGTDGKLPTYIAYRASEQTGCLLLPTVWYGSCNAMRDFPGTFDIDSDVLYHYAESIMAEAHRNGIKLLIVVNGHGGNSTPLQMAAREVSSVTGISVMVLDWWKDLGMEKASLFTSPGHAGEDETSAMLAVEEDKVNMLLAKTNEVKYPRMRTYSKTLDERIYKIALTGDAKKATKDKGEMLLDAAIQDLVSLINETREMLEI